MGNLDILKKVIHTFIRPGTIWQLPVSYLLSFPPSFLIYDEARKEFYTDENNDHWFDRENLRFIKELGVQKLVSEAEIRPFLVIQGQEIIKLLSSYAIPSWYQNAIIGFPISGINNIESINDDFQKKHTKLKLVDIDRLVNKNDYEFIYYLSKKKYPQLDKDSYIVLAAISTVSIEYFIDKHFEISEEDYKLLKLKVNKYFSFG